MSVLEAAKKLCNLYGDKELAMLAKDVPALQRLSTGICGLDYPFYGGLVCGRIYTFAGVEGSGKTTAACLEIAAYQRAHPDKICVYIDVENSLKLDFQAQMTGMNVDTLLYVAPKSYIDKKTGEERLFSGEQILQMVETYQQEEDVGMIVLDSIPSLITADALSKDADEDPGMRGSIAKVLHRILPEMQQMLARKKNILILINQVREEPIPGTRAINYKEPGGKAPNYYSSLKVRFLKATYIKKDKSGKETVDNSDPDDAYGFRLRFAITKSKISPRKRGGGFVSFDLTSGVRKTEDLLELASTHNFMKKLNSKTYQLVDLNTGELYYDEQGKPLQGIRDDLKDYILTHKEFQEKYLAMLTKYMEETTDDGIKMLSKEELNAIIQEEKSVELNGDPEDDEPKLPPENPKDGKIDASIPETLKEEKLDSPIEVSQEAEDVIKIENKNKNRGK